MNVPVVAIHSGHCTKGTMCRNSYHTRALVAHCVHASHGYRGRHRISLPSSMNRDTSKASSESQAICCQRVRDAPVSHVHPPRSATDFDTLEPKPTDNRMAANIPSGRPIDSQLKDHSSALIPRIQSVSTMMPTKKPLPTNRDTAPGPSLLIRGQLAAMIPIPSNHGIPSPSASARAFISESE